jgi:hypothetical protein
MKNPLIIEYLCISFYYKMFTCLFDITKAEKLQ